MAGHSNALLEASHEEDKCYTLYTLTYTRKPTEKTETIHLTMK